MLPHFLFVEGSMKRIKMTVQSEKTFEEGFEEYVLDMKARNLREGTIRHYQQAIKQIYKRIPEDTPISQMSEKTMPEFIVALRDDPKINEVSAMSATALSCSLMNRAMFS